MTDYWAIALGGFATGCGVIAAQRFVNFIDHHPIFRRLSSKVGEVINFDIETESGTKKKRSR
jgi:hypothetical protein